MKMNQYNIPAPAFTATYLSISVVISGGHTSMMSAKTWVSGSALAINTFWQLPSTSLCDSTFTPILPLEALARAFSANSGVPAPENSVCKRMLSLPLLGGHVSEKCVKIRSKSRVGQWKYSFQLVGVSKAASGLVRLGFCPGKVRVRVAFVFKFFFAVALAVALARRNTCVFWFCCFVVWLILELLLLLWVCLLVVVVLLLSLVALLAQAQGQDQEEVEAKQAKPLNQGHPTCHPICQKHRKVPWSNTAPYRMDGQAGGQWRVKTLTTLELYIYIRKEASISSTQGQVQLDSDTARAIPSLTASSFSLCSKRMSWKELKKALSSKFQKITICLKV